VPKAAPRIDSRLLAAIERLDDKRLPIAETNRKVGAVADAIGLTRPSYEQVRSLTRRLRSRRLDPSVGRVLLEITLRSLPPEALLDLLAGTGPYVGRRK
jgi:hypothetical protein